MEPGFGPLANYKIFDPETRAFIAKEAKRLGVRVLIHSMDEQMHRVALEMQPHALVHAGYYDEEISDHTLTAIHSAQVPVISTAAIYDMMRLPWHTLPVEDGRLKRLVPQEQLDTLYQSEAKAFVEKEIIREALPWWMPFFVAWAVKDYLFQPDTNVAFLESSLKAIKKMHEKGIPIVLGSDSGNWPIFISFFHGYGSIREWELLASAGLPLTEVLNSATIRAAALLEQSDQIASFELGKQADMILLRKNPLEDSRALRSIVGTMKTGIYRSTEDWLSLHSK